jgi:hypothetical protein
VTEKGRELRSTRRLVNVSFDQHESHGVASSVISSSPAGKSSQSPVGKPVPSFDSMGPRELMDFFFSRYEETLGHRFPLNRDPLSAPWNRALKAFRGLLEDFGPRTSGEIVERLFAAYHGREPLTHRVVSTATFSRGARWVIQPVVDDVAQLSPVGNGVHAGGMMDGQDFLDLY